MWTGVRATRYVWSLLLFVAFLSLCVGFWGLLLLAVVVVFVLFLGCVSCTTSWVGIMGCAVLLVGWIHVRDTRRGVTWWWWYCIGGDDTG